MIPRARDQRERAHISLQGSVVNMWDQMKGVQTKIQSFVDSAAPEGVHMICYSQGEPGCVWCAYACGACRGRRPKSPGVYLISLLLRWCCNEITNLVECRKSVCMYLC